MVFTIVAYRPDSTEYLRGWVHARYTSDFQLHTQLDESELLGLWSKFLWWNSQRRSGEACWQVRVLYEQRLLWDDTTSGIVVDDTRNPKDEQALIEYSHWLAAQAMAQVQDHSRYEDLAPGPPTRREQLMDSITETLERGHRLNSQVDPY